ncbi:MAG TPA: hypothetical protein VG929_02120 [Actinomycetota bacterium]|nr:hypothetical protein [Actinomycetota bacterium]
MKRSLRPLLMVMAMVSGLVATAAPAWADLDAGVGSIVKAPVTSDNDGDDSTSGTSYTEDNDTNDGGTSNNVSDDGDNAHPSGKDRSVESGGSGNQGKAKSDPDDDGRGPDRSNGGPDKPNGSGGTDKADQDGNNGCGNDDDFEDDNEGWCGKPTRTTAGNGCTKGNRHGWECNDRGRTNISGSGSSTCPNKHMGGDDAGKGANQSGAYGSTCDGSPSLNGNGTGGRGKPCAGCVGNADDKNPPGQSPDGSDANTGYECDENSGVGRTNPAHSGCTPAAAAPGPDVLGRTDLACPAGTDRAGQAMIALKDCDDNDDSVLGSIVRNAGPVGVAAKKVASAVGAVLPFTGAGDLVAFLGLAGLLLAAGAMMLRKKNEVGTEA